MFSWIKGSKFNVQRSTLGLALVVMLGCSEKQSITQKSLYNIDSLVSHQIQAVKGHELSKSVFIDGKEEQIRFAPDSLQWANELEIFRLLDQVNKASFREAYVVSEMRDTNSNLTIREIKAQQPVPVSLLRLYYLRTPNDLRKIEATFVEENALYNNTRRMMLELGRDQLLHQYRVEGLQKMVLDDSVHFVIAGIIE